MKNEEAFVSYQRLGEDGRSIIFDTDVIELNPTKVVKIESK